jgi:hypothetical protein
MSEQNPPALLANVKRGERITADDQNEMRTTINRLSRGLALPKQVSRRAQNGAASDRPFIMSVYASKSDYVLCYRVDQSVNPDIDKPLFVAKPYLLRNSINSRDGLTFSYTDTDERTATDDDSGDTEDQVVVPAYVEGDLIVVARMNTGVYKDDEQEDPVLWQDMNVDARAWAEKAS